MKIAGFNFTKISIEKSKDRVEGLKINAKINIDSINEVKPGFFKTKEELINVNFSYTIDYSPDMAKLEFKGDVLLGLEKKQAKEVLSGWKDKKMPESFQMPLYNLILRKANVKALALEDEMALPLHLPLQSLKKKE